MQPLITVKEFCKATQISVATFYRLQEAGQAPSTIKIGSRVRLSAVDVEAWLKSRRNAGAVA